VCDWEAVVRANIDLPGVRPDFRERVIRELAEQLADACEDGRLRGLSEAEAEALAREQVGDWAAFANALRNAAAPDAQPAVERTQERLADAGGAPGRWRPVAAGLGADVLHACRTLRAEPGYAGVAIGVLAVAIGAATAIFSVVDAVVLRSLPFDDPDRLVAVVDRDSTRAEPLHGGRTTVPDYLDWRHGQTAFDALAATAYATFATHDPGGEPSEARAQAVTHELFAVLGAAPMLGRPFGTDDETPGRHRVVVLGYTFWQRRFGGAPDVVGRTIDLGGEPWQVVGVMPPGFAYPVADARPPDLYVPASFSDAERSRASGHAYKYACVGRLRAGVTLAQASGQMERLAAAVDRQYPGWGRGRTVRVVTLQDRLVGHVRSWMLMLLAAVGAVLLIACANVASLMLARATTRMREAAIRAALGASRWRLVRGQLAEGLVLAFGGAAIGTLLACGGVTVLRAWLPSDLPRVATVAVDWRVLGAAVCAAVVTGLSCSLLPGLYAARRDAAGALSDGGRSATGGPGGHRLRSALVIVEIALACVLLVAAGLFGRSFVRLVSIDPGFDHASVLALPIGPPSAALPSGRPPVAGRALAFTRQVLEAVRHVPGVAMAATVAGGLPLTGEWTRWSVTLPGRGELRGDDDDVDVRRVSGDYLGLLRVPLVRGRRLCDDDRETTTPVVVVNRAAARKYWPGQDAVGQRMTIDDVERVVVGVVGDIRHFGPETPPRQEAYVPAAQAAAGRATLVLRTTRPPLEVLPAVKAAIRAIDPEQRFTAEIVTLDGYLDRLIARRRFTMALTALLGVLALVIAIAGVFGVMACSVARRIGEMGVRTALGATPGRLLAMVLGRATVLVAAGLAIGGVTAWSFGATVQAFLFEVEADDPWVFVGAAATLGLSALAASAVPARRAAAVDPLVALRHE
jgi:predicted permease